ANVVLEVIADLEPKSVLDFTKGIERKSRVDIEAKLQPLELVVTTHGLNECRDPGVHENIVSKETLYICNRGFHLGFGVRGCHAVVGGGFRSKLVDVTTQPKCAQAGYRNRAGVAGREETAGGQLQLRDIRGFQWSLGGCKLPLTGNFSGTGRDGHSRDGSFGRNRVLAVQVHSSGTKVDRKRHGVHRAEHMAFNP